MYDLIIIGGGPAAIGAAIYALGKGLNLAMIYQAPGGKTGWHQRLMGQLAEEEITGEHAIHLLEQQVMQRANRIQDRVHKVSTATTFFQVHTEQHGTLETLAVIIATGATPRLLDVPGADELAGQGLGYSITTHAHLLPGKAVAVVGATPRSLRGAAEIAATAEHIYIIAYDARELTAPLARALSHRPNVTLLEGYKVVEITGAFNVEEIVVTDGAEQRRLAVDAVFVDLGLYANSDCVRSLIHTEPRGFITVNVRNETLRPGLFAAGDVTSKPMEQKLVALGDGTNAAVHAYSYVLWRRWGEGQ